MKAIKFSQSHCMPCKALSMKLQQKGINIEERELTREDAALYGLRSVPAIVILDNDGNRMETYLGANLTEQQYDKLLTISNGA